VRARIEKTAQWKSGYFRLAGYNQDRAGKMNRALFHRLGQRDISCGHKGSSAQTPPGGSAELAAKDGEINRK
jgi:hypothetical protein